MTEPVGPLHGHWNADRILQVSEGSADAATRHALAEHLSACGQCMATYADLVEMQHSRIVDPSIASPGAGWIKLGLELAQPAAPVAVSKPKRVWVRAPVVATAGLAIGAALLITVFALRRNDSFDDRQVRVALVQAGAPGGLLYAPDLLPTQTGLRGQAPASTPSLQEILRQRRSRELNADRYFYLIAGNIADGQEMSAALFLEEAMGLYPADLRFTNLVAMLDIMRNDLAAAEQRLRSVQEIDRSGLTEFNLSRVLALKGRHDEARLLLEHVRASSPHPELAHYAGVVLEAK